MRSQFGILTICIIKILYKNLIIYNKTYKGGQMYLNVDNFLWVEHFENLPQYGVKSKQVKKSATLRSFALTYMGNPYLVFNKLKGEKVLAFYVYGL